jgi:transposase, IS30 family
MSTSQLPKPAIPPVFHHTKLTKEERIELSSFLKAGLTQVEIAYHLKKDKSTISREITRNKDPTTGEYCYSLAHKQAKERKACSNKIRSKIPIGGSMEKYIITHLKLNWSPEQIAGRLKRDMRLLGFTSVPTYQTIYNHIYLYLPDMKQYLRIIGVKGRYRRKYGTKLREKLREESKKKRIDTRPEVINTRARLGDWEGDTIVGGEKTIHILTHVERKSGYLLASKVEQATSEVVQNLTIKAFTILPRTRVKSITYDNGVQFNKHEDTENKLSKYTKNKGFSIYFANPYHSWERGTNENTNGLIRKYYPKKTPFKGITQKQLDKTVTLINNRPRKRLNYLTPQEVFRGTKQVSEKHIKNPIKKEGMQMPKEKQLVAIRV